jgi:ABC-type antimicrobial peptide transport system permease subunit
MARQFFPNESPLGRRIQAGALPDADTPWMEIVGVVGDVKQNLATDAPAEVYLPYREANAIIPVFVLSIVLRTAQDPRTEVAALRTVVHDLDPNQPVTKFRTMEENIASSVSEQRFRTTLLGIFATCALLLSVVGLYGLMMYSVTQRVPEIGIRITLGASRHQILGMVVGQGLRLAAVGIVAGIAGAFALSRILARFLYGVTVTDPLTYAGVAALLLAVAILASYLPARRATAIDPMAALRSE